MQLFTGLDYVGFPSVGFGFLCSERYRLSEVTLRYDVFCFVGVYWHVLRQVRICGLEFSCFHVLSRPVSGLWIVKADAIIFVIHAVVTDVDVGVGLECRY
jgi:hypothetical protein